MVSLLVPLEDGAMIETGVVGREGFTGLAALMSADETATQTSMVQLPGSAVRIATEVLRRAMVHRSAVLDRVLRFAHALSIQTSQTAACNAHHDLQERLARWLLMAHDRAEDDVLALTHEFVSMMLAVRRPGVTVAARSLQTAGAIDYERGRITVLDRGRLEEAACECYGIVREQCQRLLGWPSVVSMTASRSRPRKQSAGLP
jgi:CRP-like cAMP-binding protein